MVLLLPAAGSRCSQCAEVHLPPLCIGAVCFSGFTHAVMP